MQDRYTGDIGDFGKLGLLRRFQKAGLSIGVNWYLTPNESHNSDGAYVNYPQLRPCDADLWDALKDVVESGQRSVLKLQKESILKAVFYSKRLDFTGKAKAERQLIRDAWHQEALQALNGAELVFVDPDNGLVVRSAKGTSRENKYVTPEELASYYAQGASVVYYQHKARWRDEVYTDQHKQLLRQPGFADASALGLKFTKTSLRYYFFILQPEHKDIVVETVQKMMKTEWRNCFGKIV